MIRKSIGAVLFTGTLLIANTTPAQNVEVTTTNSAGTISEFSPERIIIKTESSPDPLRYTYSKTTTYVDETGAPVSLTTVKSGLPVTVYYTKVGDTMVASKVIVRRAVVVPAPAPAPAPVPAVEEKKTTTTTTTTKEK